MSLEFEQDQVADTVVQRVARAIWTEWTSLRVSLGDDLPDVDYDEGADKPSSEFIARAAIAAMRDPPSTVVMAVEEKAEERYRADPGMARWYGDDVWNAGVDAALMSGRGGAMAGSQALSPAPPMGYKNRRIGGA